MNALVTFKDSSLALIRKTVAKDCDQVEFDQFIHIAKAVGLDPLRRQIYAFVFGKKGKDRQLTVVTGIDGYRAISARSGDYRPADKPTLYEYDQTAKSPSNPLGIIRAEVTLYKHAHGGWHAVIGEAFWDEMVPTVYRDEDIVKVDTGDKWPDGNPKYKRVPKEGAQPIVDPNKTGWVKSPRNQIAKCAEAQAHRKGWPNDFAGLEVQEEVDRRHTLDLTASEAADYAETQDRLLRVGGGNSFVIDWCDGLDLASVPGGQLYDAAMGFIEAFKDEDPDRIRLWQKRNAVSLKQWWASHMTDALALKKELEKLQEGK